MRKEEADAQRKADDEAKKKIALTNMGSGFSSHLQRVRWISLPLFCVVVDAFHKGAVIMGWAFLD